VFATFAMSQWIDMASIHAHSLITSLGYDAATSCAAARAGLSRACAIPEIEFTFDVTGEAEPVVAHAVPFLTRGFEGHARLQRLLFAGLSELKKQLNEDLLKTGLIGFYLSLPDPARTAHGHELMSSDGVRADCIERANELGDEPSDAEFAHKLLAVAVAQADWPGNIHVRYVSLAGHAGGLHCIAMAKKELDAGHITTAIVGAADSLIDSETIAWLHSTNRLKLSGMPVGLMPGEASAFLVLSNNLRENDAEITGVGISAEAKTLWSGATSVGEGLASALEQVAEIAQWKLDSPAWVICDQNGEIYRANEWGHVATRLRATWPALESPVAWMPAASFGDTGCASSLVAVCIALQAFKRKYAPADCAVVTSSSEAEFRSAIVVNLKSRAVALKKGDYDY
jgi:hypothetical protein